MDARGVKGAKAHPAVTSGDARTHVSTESPDLLMIQVLQTILPIHRLQQDPPCQGFHVQRGFCLPHPARAALLPKASCDLQAPRAYGPFLSFATSSSISGLGQAPPCPLSKTFAPSGSVLTFLLSPPLSCADGSSPILHPYTLTCPKDQS